MEHNSTSRAIIDLIIKHIDSQKSDREVAKKANISNTSIDLYRKGASMKLDTMEKILDAFPELRQPIAELLLGESLKKHTAATNNDEAAVNETLRKFGDSIAKLTEANLIANQTIAQLLSREVVKQG